MAYAHSANAAGRRHALEDHLRAVAEQAARFAAPLSASSAAYWLGLWHDLGKYAPAWQSYLLAAEQGHKMRGPDHKAAGASLAARHLGYLAMLVQGHHGGLRAQAESKAWLVAMQGAATDSALEAARAAGLALAPDSPPELPPAALSDPLAADLLMRLLFSALVDADYIDTEAHFAGAPPLRQPQVDMAELWARLERAQTGLSGHQDDPVNAARHEIYQACVRSAEGPVGLYRLTVPTGGGKTRSALAFALRHALRHGQERVIVAIPYISITEQTTDVYRAILEADPAEPLVVLEHHSGASWSADDDVGDPRAAWARLAAENWDAPVIVTTTVQLFDSLFSNRPGRARRLHRLSNAVIVLDEAQALPSRLLAPILDVLARLPSACHSSVVLSTATQPAFQAIPAFRDVQAREIVPEPERYFSRLRRVSYEFRTDPPLEWDEVAELLAAEPQALAIVNTRRDALNLLAALDDPDALHLSTLLCGAHRRRVLAEVHRRLAAGAPCRLVSTQVVEAGVDLDYPVVLRALGPLDSIIQAAGRCNREGRLTTGRVVVFAPREGGLPPGDYQAATGITGALIGTGRLDPDAADAARTYFERLFDTIDTDGEGIQTLRQSLNYPEVAARFRMIDDDAVGAVVPYGSDSERRRVQSLLDALRRPNPRGRAIWRALQPYLVNIRFHEAQRYERQGLLSPVAPGLGEWLGRYDCVCGLSDVEMDSDS